MHYTSATSVMKISRECKSELGSRIRKLRFDSQGNTIINLLDLERRTGINHRNLSQMETGSSLLSMSAMERVLDVLTVPPSEREALLALHRKAWDITPERYHPKATHHEGNIR